MFDKFFGIYLLNKKLISNEDMQKILHHMKSTHIKIGTLAIKEGLMTGTQVEEINLLQRSKDKKFGELAIEKGLINQNQLESLLQKQSEESNLQLGQAAVDLGYLTYKQLDHELKNFQNDAGFSNAQLEALKTGDQEQIVRQFIDFDNPVFYEYVSLLLRNIIRFLDQHPWIEIEESFQFQKDPAEEVTAYQYLDNEQKIFTGIAMDEKTFKTLAAQFAKMPVEDDRLAEASITEFLNLHNGIFTVNMSNQDKKFEMSPPDISRNKLPGDMEVTGGKYQIDINTSLGKIKLILAS